MGRFKKLAPEVEATQWFKNGDHPLDGEPETEGSVVRYFRDPDFNGTSRCPFCSMRYEEHGWLDVEAGSMVCPGSWVVTDEGHIFVIRELYFRMNYVEIPEERT